jgi:rhodanese-related sulfurtransferase
MNTRRAIAVPLLLGSFAAVTHGAEPAHQAALRRFEAEVDAAFAGVPELTAADFLARADRDRFLVVDGRTAPERAVSRIEGAIALDQLAAAAGPNAPALLVYCTIGMRSAAAVLELRGQGYEAFNLRGGVLAWADAGGRFVDSGGATTRTVHVYGRRWNHLPPGYHARF